MTRAEADRVIEVIRGDLDDWKVEVRGGIARIEAKVDSVEAEAKKTNGRLRRLEMWRHGLEAVERAQAWVKPAAIAFATGAGLAVLGAFLSRL